MWSLMTDCKDLTLPKIRGTLRKNSTKSGEKGSIPKLTVSSEGRYLFYVLADDRRGNAMSVKDCEIYEKDGIALFVLISSDYFVENFYGSLGVRRIFRRRSAAYAYPADNVAVYDQRRAAAEKYKSVGSIEPFERTA